MGVAAQVFALKEDRLALILAHPPLLMKLLAPDDEDAVRMMQDELAKPAGLFGFLRKKPMAALPDVEFSEEEQTPADLDKAWHAIHFLFTGVADNAAPPLNFLDAGGTPVPGSDVGLGASRVFSAAQTREMGQALAALSEDALMARYDGPKMVRLDIYPAIWERPESRDYVRENLKGLRDFLLKAAAEGKGLVVCMS